MWKPTEIKKEIEAFEWGIRWLKTRTAKGICLILLLVGFIFLIIDFKSYSTKQQQVFRIYPEILANVNEIGIFINKWADTSGVNLMIQRPKSYFKEAQLVFTHERFDQYYDGFGKPSLDIQISNFYINLKKYKPKFFAEVFIPLKEQGEDVIKKMNYYFGCRDFFSKQDRVHYIISADASAPTFSIVRYLRYKFK